MVGIILAPSHLLTVYLPGSRSLVQCLFLLFRFRYEGRMCVCMVFFYSSVFVRMFSSFFSLLSTSLFQTTFGFVHLIQNDFRGIHIVKHFGKCKKFMSLSLLSLMHSTLFKTMFQKQIRSLLLPPFYWQLPSTKSIKQQQTFR